MLASQEAAFLFTLLDSALQCSSFLQSVRTVGPSPHGMPSHEPSALASSLSTSKDTLTPPLVPLVSTGLGESSQVDPSNKVLAVPKE